jgi:hypothetical protein
MLTYILVWIISLGSVGLYLIAYLFPEIHRKNDWIGGGVGLFYGLILAANAQTMPAGLLVGHFASVGLILWLGQQMLSQRRLLVTEDAPRPVPGSMRDRLRTLVLQTWKWLEPLRLFMANSVAKLLEKPQEANISEIEVNVPEAVKTNFLNQLTEPLSNLSGNLTGLFKPNAKNLETIHTVTVKATPAPEEETASSPTVSRGQAEEPAAAEVVVPSEVPSEASMPESQAAAPQAVEGDDLTPKGSAKPEEWNEPDPLA